MASSTSHIKVLFFDVFGTCVSQRGSVTNELHEATRQALKDDSMSSEIRRKVERMCYNDWYEFGGEWNKAESKYQKDSITERNAVDWKAVDKNRIELLPKLLAQRGLVIPSEDADAPLKVGKGSLWNEKQLEHLGLVWHRLAPWPDTNQGISLFNKRFKTSALSNTYNSLMTNLVAQGGIPFNEVYTADMWDSFKPNPKVYLGAAEKIGVKPEECALVAAHLGDLKAAKACGFYAIYVERPDEEKNPELRDEGIPDLWVKESENGFVAVAERLGIQAD